MEVDNIYSRLAGIGIELSGVVVDSFADIEKTILEASLLVGGDDRKLLGLLSTWISHYGRLVQIGRLDRLLKKGIGDPQIISALANLAVDSGQHEWKKLCLKYADRYLFGKESTLVALKFKKAQTSFLKAGVIIIEDSVRIREGDVVGIERLATVSHHCRMRLLYGTNLRSDVAFYMKKGLTTTSQIVAAIGSSYEPVYRTLRDFKLAAITNA